ncbi:MAG TPA: hypothetical protein VEL69_06080, partial [Ktedonobacteraceae bacterium]|nr:hypothetical protein [Ktedonobacteraceae bacterium]
SQLLGGPPHFYGVSIEGEDGADLDKRRIAPGNKSEKGGAIFENERATSSSRLRDPQDERKL